MEKSHLLLYFFQDGNPFQFGELGRQAFSTDPDVTMTMTESEDSESGGVRLSITWEGPSDKVFEDCFDFGKDFNIQIYLFFPFYKLYQIRITIYVSKLQNLYIIFCTRRQTMVRRP